MIHHFMEIIIGRFLDVMGDIEPTNQNYELGLLYPIGLLVLYPIGLL